MKKLLKHMGCLVVSGTIFVAAACGNGSGNGSDADSANIALRSTLPGTDTATTPTAVPADTVASTVAAPGATSQADAAFVGDAVASNAAEIAAHKAAVSRAENKEVRMHAQHMLTDHNKLGDNLKAYARTKSYSVPADMPADKKAALDAMNGTPKGSAWDKAYVSQQVADHQATIAKFEAAEQTVADPELKSLIATALPQLRLHLQMVQELQGKLK